MDNNYIMHFKTHKDVFELPIKPSFIGKLTLEEYEFLLRESDKSENLWLSRDWREIEVLRELGLLEILEEYTHQVYHPKTGNKLYNKPGCRVRATMKGLWVIWNVKRKTNELMVPVRVSNAYTNI